MTNKTDKPFHKKEWFMWLMLILIAPIGLILLWRNKKYITKTKWILTGVFTVWFIIMGIAAQPTEEEIAEKEAKEERKQQREEEKKKKKEEEKKEEEERLANRSIDEAIEEDDHNVDDAELSDEGELTLTIDASGSFSPNSVAETYVYRSFESMNDAFKDEDVDEVEVIIEVPLVDNKGNEEVSPVVKFTYTRDAFDELNYDNFETMAVGEPWRILNESDAYFMHPAIYDEVKQKYRDGLSHGKSKVRNYEEE